MTALVVGAALLLSGPSLIGAFRGTTDVDTALLHLALALLASAIAGRVLRSVYQGYVVQAAQTAAERAATEKAEKAATAAAERAESARRRQDG